MNMIGIYIPIWRIKDATAQQLQAYYDNLHSNMED